MFLSRGDVGIWVEEYFTVRLSHALKGVYPPWLLRTPNTYRTFTGFYRIVTTSHL